MLYSPVCSIHSGEVSDLILMIITYLTRPMKSYEYYSWNLQYMHDLRQDSIRYGNTSDMPRLTLLILFVRTGMHPLRGRRITVKRQMSPPPCDRRLHLSLEPQLLSFLQNHFLTQEFGSKLP